MAKNPRISPTDRESGTYAVRPSKEDAKFASTKGGFRREMEMMVGEEFGQRSGGAGVGVVSQSELAAKLKKELPREGNYTAALSSNEDLIQVLSEQQGMEYVTLTNYKLGDPAVLKLIPAEIAMSYKCLPIQFEDDGALLVAIADPLNIQITDDLQLLTNRVIRPVVANEDDLTEFVTLHYGMGDETIEDMVDQLEGEGAFSVSIGADETDLSNLEEIAAQAPVIRLANILLLQAIKDRASDLHIEPFSNTLRIRYRVDGLLREIPPPPKSLQIGLISRLKVMANMDISENRRPQDGRIKLTLESREIDLRVSTMPTVHGESMVMRILDKQMMMIGIGQLGMTKKDLVKFQKEIRKPNGIVVVTGPTGSGKTTTLYAALAEINDPGDKIITTEDPVEYEVPGLIQVNINTKIGLTFDKCLRAILRQDPDKILVGEIRDIATAQISIQASLTGHLVFSTLHTNSAAATITRLIDMGIEPFLLTSTLEAIVGQRLIRLICPSCVTEYTPTDVELEEFMMTPDLIGNLAFKAGTGCEECQFSGYKGRIGLYELLQVTDEIKELILQRESQEVITHAALQRGMSTMRKDGWMKICMGLSTFEEVSRNTPRESIEQIELEMKSVVSKARAHAGIAGGQAPDNAPPLEAPAADAPPLAPPPPQPQEGGEPPPIGDAARLPEPPTEEA